MSARRLHWAPCKAISWPSGGKRRPNCRTFMPRGDTPVCMVVFGEGTNDRDAVTCKRCIRVMGIARFDTESTVRAVLSRGLGSNSEDKT